MRASAEGAACPEPRRAITSSQGDVPSDDDLIRLVLRSLAGLVSLLLALAVTAAASRGPQESTNQSAAPASEASGGLGPPAGRALRPYVQGRAATLAAARGRATAVVSFSSYFDERAARRIVREGGTTLRSLLVAVPGGRPGEVPAGSRVSEFVRRQREEAVAERRAIQQLLPTATDPDFARQYEDDLSRLTALVRSLEKPGRLVFGAVVDATTDELRALARLPAVRMVDPAAVHLRLDRGEARGVRPEETETAGVPPERPAE